MGDDDRGFAPRRRLRGDADRNCENPGAPMLRRPAEVAPLSWVRSAGADAWVQRCPRLGLHRLPAVACSKVEAIYWVTYSQQRQRHRRNTGLKFFGMWRVARDSAVNGMAVGRRWPCTRCCWGLGNDRSPKAGCSSTDAGSHSSLNKLH